MKQAAGVIGSVVRHWVLPILAALAVMKATTFVSFRSGAVSEGELAPDFEVINLEGHPVALSSFRGRPVVLNFWATWCGPCKQEIPALSRVAADHPEAEFVGVALDSGDWRGLAAQKGRLGIGFPVYEGSAEVQRTWEVRTLPTTYFIDAEGLVVASHVGVIAETKLRYWLR